ncbi:MAG: hypothetical protein Q4B27_02065 [Candidatus Saccharibacteria bacterium]|nr:hypothetical protein [Candidatus Saccharibacteria bacterium]
MPICNPADYPAIIARLKAKLAEKGVVMGPNTERGGHHCLRNCLQHAPARGLSTLPPAGG